MSETLSSSTRRSSRRSSVLALLAAALLTMLLWTCSALPAEAKKGGVPAWQAQGVTSSDGAGGQGANDLSGPYDPDPADPAASGVGQPSGNGASTDNNGNRPCAGCVGNADYKNPPGQLPDGSDHNKGYECDSNQGVGKMNPAHSGCAPAPAVSPPTQPVTPPARPVTPPTRPVTPPAPAVTPPAPPVSGPSQPTAGAPAPVVRGERAVGNRGGARETETTRESPEVALRPAVAVSPRAVPTALHELPFTGGEPLELALLGLLSLAMGLGLAVALRPRAPA